MERLQRNRDQILFGHASRCSLPRGDSRLEPRTSADVDFSDVFGGPPKTPSAFDRHHGFSKSADASISIGGSERFERKQEVAEHEWRWSTSNADNLEHHRNFRGHEYASSIDPSPVLILDHLRNSTANARRSGRAKNEPKSINHNPIYKIPQPNWANEIQNLYGGEDSGRLSYTGGNFHFSIYKWASTEMSLVMPYNLKNKIKSSRRVNGASKVQHGDSDARLTKDGRNDIHSKIVIDDRQKDRKGDEDTGVQTRERKSFLYRYVGKWKDADNDVNMGHATRENATHVSNNVKEFIKIFNNGTTQKSNAKFENQLQKPRPRHEDKERQKVAEMDKMVDEKLSTPTTVEQRLRKTVELVSDKNVSWIKREDPTSEADASPAFPPGARGASFHNIKAFNVNLDGSLVDDLGGCQNEVPEADLYRERIQASDAKIREWSRGKEGNIRSLLSTLQYVLWPESGWKPVPLVGIIEGAAVRRAYQKAMLCLHPDKLQQKRVEMHQKYVAQKVFNILQEAWTHFNSLSSL